MKPLGELNFPPQKYYNSIKCGEKHIASQEALIILCVLLLNFIPVQLFMVKHCGYNLAL